MQKNYIENDIQTIRKRKREHLPFRLKSAENEVGDAGESRQELPEGNLLRIW